VSIDFTPRQWAHLAEVTDLWWSGQLDRPLISVTLSGKEPHRRPPKLQGDLLAAVWDPHVPAEDIVDAWDYQLHGCQYLGDAFPSCWPYMGPIYNVAFFGAAPKVGSGTTWYFPAEEREIADLHFAHDPDDVRLRRARDIFQAAADRWAGRVCIGMTAAATGLDILSVFRPAEKLLFDLVDHPDEVHRCIEEIREATWLQWDEFDRIITPGNPGHTSWTPIYSTRPHVMWQCDFAYMISPAMFDEFVRDDLAACCRKVARNFYHLDGVGQLPHLDSMLAIDQLHGIQWVPGTGKPDLPHWPEVYRRIRQAGRLVQIWGGIDTLDAIADQVGSARGIILITGGHVSQRKDFEKALARYGVI
jgi:5-methyltetrahydrofolate--homocysteine methyltransferase